MNSETNFPWQAHQEVVPLKAGILKRPEGESSMVQATHWQHLPWNCQAKTISALLLAWNSRDPMEYLSRFFSGSKTSGNKEIPLSLTVKKWDSECENNSVCFEMSTAGGQFHTWPSLNPKVYGAGLTQCLGLSTVDFLPWVLSWID